ncbi:MAG TPA: amidohydrolase [Acidobacteriota bacterium]|nr:amidohydrolase [Acidobacteriota bacterium]
MKARTLFFNARIYTQAFGLVVDSLAVCGHRVIAVGNRLEQDPDFKAYAKVDLGGRTIVPGLVDAHAHFYYFALSLGRVSLDGLESLEACLEKIRTFSRQCRKSEWVLGDGYSPDRFTRRVEPDRYVLDAVTGGRPAFIFSKDQHSVWVNSRALEIAGIGKDTRDPAGGKIDRLADGTPSGIFREQAAYDPVLACIDPPSPQTVQRRYRQALQHAYRKGVTAVHSFDGPDGFAFFNDLALKGRLGLRINYYPAARLLPELRRTGTRYGCGDDFLRIAGVKVFADGSLGSQTALCFDPYIGTGGDRGIEATSVADMKKIIRSAARLGLPCAIHAIGDKAVANVLDAFEMNVALPAGARHRIEHLQLLWRRDISRIRRLKVVASMQPSHCPSDMHMIRKYWGKRGANAFIFRTLIDRGVDLAFGSDAPIELLDPMAGIAAAARRARPGSRDVFYPDQRIKASEALYRFTVGPAVACGQEHCRGYLLPGYPADLVVLSQDITRVAPTRIRDTEVLATILDGRVVYCHSSLAL